MQFQSHKTNTHIGKGHDINLIIYYRHNSLEAHPCYGFHSLTLLVLYPLFVYICFCVCLQTILHFCPESPNEILPGKQPDQLPLFFLRLLHTGQAKPPQPWCVTDNLHNALVYTALKQCSLATLRGESGRYSHIFWKAFLTFWSSNSHLLSNCSHPLCKALLTFLSSPWTNTLPMESPPIVRPPRPA